jgi:membrane associated rhomboid family serine protease/Zn-finger nucleic acid-binding protein
MLCPVCKKQMMSRQIGEVTVDICSNCGGIWFDKDELKETLSILKKSSEIPFRNFKPLPREDEAQEFREIYCPRCATALKPFNYAYDSGIFLDRCPSCGGIWADRDETESIASFLKGNPKLEKLGKSYLDHSKERQTWIDLKEASPTMMSNAFYWQFLPLIVLPVGDENPRQHFPWVTMALILINIIIFICEVIFISDPQSFFNRYGSIPVNIASGKNLYTLLSSIFLHGSLLHVLGNMFFLWIFGDNVEDIFRPFKFLVLYLTSGILGDVLHTFTHLASNMPMVGASGAISGLMGAYFVMFPTARMKIFFVKRVIYLPAALYIGAWISFQIIYGLADIGLSVSNVGFFAHVGSFVAGMLFAFIAKKFRAETSPAY